MGNGIPTYLLHEPQKEMENFPGHRTSLVAEENLNLCLSISELANHKSSAEVIDIMNVDLHFSITFYQFQKRIHFFLSLKVNDWWK